MVNQDDLIWIEDAETQYNRSREWLLKQVKAGLIRRVEIPGDRKVYLLRSELDKLLKPRIVD
jgi:hypothetical protein